MTVRQRVAGASPAMKFVVMVGIMSFFADFTYEGSRSITGPYLGLLGTAWVAGSIVIGALFNVSLIAIVVFSMAAEFAGIPLILMVRKRTAA